MTLSEMRPDADGDAGPPPPGAATGASQAARQSGDEGGDNGGDYIEYLVWESDCLVPASAAQIVAIREYEAALRLTYWKTLQAGQQRHPHQSRRPAPRQRPLRRAWGSFNWAVAWLGLRRRRPGTISREMPVPPACEAPPAAEPFAP